MGPDGGNSLQFTGRENDGTGLYFYRARYYDSLLGRFISEDPVGLQGGTNRYAYIGGSPVLHSDPMGLRCPPGDVMCGIAERQAGIPQPQPEVPSSSTLSVCEMQWLNDNYGTFGGFMTDTLNLQQYLPSAPTPVESWKTGMEVGAEKVAATRGVGAAGKRFSIPWATVWGGISSATLEIVGGGFTVFATMAKSLAELNCSCPNDPKLK